MRPFSSSRLRTNWILKSPAFMARTPMARFSKSTKTAISGSSGHESALRKRALLDGRSQKTPSAAYPDAAAGGDGSSGFCCAGNCAPLNGFELGRLRADAGPLAGDWQPSVRRNDLPKTDPASVLHFQGQGVVQRATLNTAEIGSPGKFRLKFAAVVLRSNCSDVIVSK